MTNDNDRPFMQRFYDSEINASIEWYWDGGFLVERIRDCRAIGPGT
jgi:hypothetical protein